jgi:hypothetical protein
MGIRNIQRRIAVEKRWVLCVHAVDRHHLAKGAIMDVRQTSHQAVDTPFESGDL